MKSIRNRLLFWLLGGVLILFVLAGSCAFFTVRYVLMTGVEAELQQARKVVYNIFQQGALASGYFIESAAAPGRRQRLRNEERWREFDYEDGELLYQLKKANGEILLRSVSFGERTIRGPVVLASPRKSAEVTLQDNTRLRVRVDYVDAERRPVAAPADGEAAADNPIEIIVGRDVSEIRQTLSLLLGGIWAAGLVGAAATAGLVTVVLRKGLSPLDELGGEVAKIDAKTLAVRFGNNGVPDELQPICERLNDLMGRLENAFDRERQFSSDLAHEIRTPIAEISVMAEAAMLHPDKCPGQYEKILASAREMQRITESLLDLARWEQGSGELEMDDLVLAEIVEECWEPYSSSAEEKELDVRIDVQPSQTIVTNAGLFRNILNNLFANAVEYTPRRGKVTIESLEGANGRGAGLSVSNSVDEMEPSEVKHLFERFWRRDPSRTGTGHSGLGLSVARACAEVLSLDLAAELDDGSLRFSISR